MINKEFILDSLVEEMFKENLIIITASWVNEFGERPYAMTSKGRTLWQDAVKNEDD